MNLCILGKYYQQETTLLYGWVHEMIRYTQYCTTCEGSTGEGLWEPELKGNTAGEIRVSGREQLNNERVQYQYRPTENGSFYIKYILYKTTT